MALTSTVLSVNIGNVYVSSNSNAITTMYFCNTGNSTAHFNVFAVPVNSDPGMNNVVYYQVPLTSHDTYVIDTEKLILEDGDRLCANIVDPAVLEEKGLFDSGWGSNVVYAGMWSTDRTEYVIVGDGGKVAISQTGESWDYQPGIVNLGWPDDVKANDITRIPFLKYVVVGDSGWMAASADGINWGYQNALSSTAWGSTNINAIANNGSLYVAVGDQGSVATSINGSQWTVQNGLSTTDWGNFDVYTIIWDGERFLVGGDEGRLASSADGVDWTYISNLADNPAWGTATRLTTLVYSGSTRTGYLALSYDNNKAAFSYDGETWTYNSGLAGIADLTVPGVGGATHKPGFGFYILGNSSDIYIFDLMQFWSLSTTLRSMPWEGHAGTDIIWNGERAEFLAMGHGARVATSGNGVDWTFRSGGASSVLPIPDVVATVFSIGI